MSSRNRNAAGWRDCHVRCTYRSLEDVVVPRCTKSKELVWIEGRAGDPPQPILSMYCLLTAAFGEARDVYRRCISYDLRGYCAAGPRCPFVHIIDIDSSQAVPRRRLRPGQSKCSQQQVASAPRHQKKAEAGGRWWRHEPYIALTHTPRVFCARLQDSSSSDEIQS